MAEALQIDTEKYRALLLAERSRLQRAVQRPVTDDRLGADQSDNVGDISDYPDHPADLGSETTTIETDMTLKQNARGLLHQVDAALIKMDQGTYGICASCKKPIPEKRLAAKPSAIYCVPCQSTLEALGTI